MTTALAIHGGTPYRTAPFPRRAPFGDREVELVTEAIRSQNLFGPGNRMVPEFERRFADLYGVPHVAASSSGTAAIHVAVGTLNPEPGDEIITAPITDLGTVVPIIYQTAIPVFADVDETYNMDPADVERKITPRTRAILVVHLFGNPANMDAIMAIARRHGLPVIEDCSQAHLTSYKGRLCGTIGDLGAFSLQQSKHMTTGDGGMTISARDDLAERMRFFTDKGWTRKPGWGARTYLFLAPNYRMTELQGAVGLAQVEKVRAVVARRTELGNRLTARLRGLPGLLPAPVTEGGTHTYWSYPLRVTRWTPRSFAGALRAEGVPAGGGYIGKPIYLCAEALCAQATFGTSGFPFTSPYVRQAPRYDESLCPRAQDALDHMVTLSIVESYSEQDIDDMAGAIAKVAELLPPDAPEVS
ncbi:MAG TPA: DegT/DnrJ/EryC1/StrS family aminotransferase [Chloroflexota bacterium]|nr:DegT/DnrJ/EryC1/StrS family aminotransferase [Chloroflexota bacterium]